MTTRSTMDEPVVYRSERSTSHRIERFSFDVPEPAGGHSTRSDAAGSGASSLPGLPIRAAYRQDRRAEACSEAALEMERACAEAYQQGIEAAGGQHEAELRSLREAVSLAVDEFAQDRFRYFRRVEKEVVELSLSIARRILNRESQLDPLVLQGAVRAVLESVSDGSACVMRVRPESVGAWEAWFESQSPRQRPKVVPDGALNADRCILETSMGTTDIGIDAQLREIESGFCDLIASSSINEKSLTTG